MVKESVHTTKGGEIRNRSLQVYFGSTYGCLQVWYCRRKKRKKSKEDTIVVKNYRNRKTFDAVCSVVPAMT